MTAKRIENEADRRVRLAVFNAFAAVGRVVELASRWTGRRRERLGLAAIAKWTSAADYAAQFGRSYHPMTGKGRRRGHQPGWARELFAAMRCGFPTGSRAARNVERRWRQGRITTAKRNELLTKYNTAPTVKDDGKDKE